MSWLITGTYKGAAVSDADAQTYLRAVETADNQGPLEQGVQQAVNQFVIGCKADGIWTAIKASCILAGARTLAGALVPLVGAAPTNVGGLFVSGDYNRKTGLVGDGSTKYLNSNRNNNADPQNNNHNACWVSSPAVGILMASSAGNTGHNYLDIIGTPGTRFYSRTNAATNAIVTGPTGAGLYGHSRSASNGYVTRCPQGAVTPFNANSQSTEARPVLLYTRSDDGVAFGGWSTARLAFYSIGESLGLALLDARVTTLINAFDAAI
jgi:hypothetical protein